MAGAREVLAIALPIVVGLALIALANVVMRHGRQHRHTLFFAALYFLSGLKSLSDGLAVTADAWNAEAALFPAKLFWDLLGIFCALGMMPLLLLFVLSFPRPVEWLTDHPRRAAMAFAPSALVAAILVLFLAGQLPPAPYLVAVSAFNVLFFSVTVVAIVLLLRTWTRSPDPIERSQATYVLLGFIPAFVTGWAVSAIQLGSGSLVDPETARRAISDILHFVSPVVELAACGLVGFAILKYNLLGINPRFRLGVKAALAGAMFVGLFLATQFIENILLEGKVFSFAGDYGFLLSGATGLVLFKPIGKVSDRAAQRLLPGARAKGGQDGGERTAAAAVHAEQIYHAQCTYVLRDAQVTQREMALLRNLRVQLGLSEAQARAIEQTVEGLLQVDAPETGQAPGPPPDGVAPAGAASATVAAEPSAPPKDST